MSKNKFVLKIFSALGWDGGMDRSANPFIQKMSVGKLHAGKTHSWKTCSVPHLSCSFSFMNEFLRHAILPPTFSQIKCLANRTEPLLPPSIRKMFLRQTRFTNFWKNSVVNHVMFLLNRITGCEAFSPVLSLLFDDQGSPSSIRLRRWKSGPSLLLLLLLLSSSIWASCFRLDNYIPMKIRTIIKTNGWIFTSKNFNLSSLSGSLLSSSSSSPLGTLTWNLKFNNYFWLGIQDSRIYNLISCHFFTK